MHFCVLRRNSRQPPKVVGKGFMGKVASRFRKNLVIQKFRRNHYSSLRFRDKPFTFLHFT